MPVTIQSKWGAQLIVALSLALWAAVGLAQTAPQVLFKTSMGDFSVEVYPQKAPKTVDNFLRYVKDKHYDGTVFHRVMDGFMVQGGGFTADMKQKPTREPVALEAMNGLKNELGTIAMARTSDPNSATSQFFINVVNNPALNAPQPDGYGYTVFGKVVSGMDVVNKIRAVPVGNQGMFQNVPRAPITIVSVNLSK